MHDEKPPPYLLAAWDICMTSSRIAMSFVDRARSGLKLGRHSMFKTIPLLKVNTLRFLRKLMFSITNIVAF